MVNAHGKKWLVLDFRYVNQFTLLTKLKYEGLNNIIPHIFSKGDYFFTFDLKSGYHHVDIHGVMVPVSNVQSAATWPGFSMHTMSSPNYCAH